MTEKVYKFILKPPGETYTETDVDENRQTYAEALFHGKRIDCWGRICTPYAQMLGLSDKQADILYDISRSSYKVAAKWLLDVNNENPNEYTV